MPQQITCAACGCSLRLPDQARERSLTCPRCLAQVANPNVSTAGGAPFSADHDVHQDSRRAGCGLIGLAVLGGLGLVVFLLPSVLGAIEEGISVLVPISVVVCVLAAIATGVAFVKSRHDPAALGVGRVILGTLAAAGVLCLVLVAAFIIFCVVCLVNPKLFF